jgi:hypothetical protein
MARFASAVWRTDLLRQLTLLLASVWLYRTGRRLIDPDWPKAIANAHKVLHLERVLHLDFEAPLQHAFLNDPSVVRALNLFYLSAHFVVTGLFFCWLYFRSREGFRTFRNGFMIATGLALLIHWGFPTAPPRVAGIGLEDTLRQLSGIDIGSPTTAGGFSNPVAAVPSLHAGWALAVGVGLVLYGGSRWLRAVGVVYPALVTLTILVTGNHFVLDAVAGDLVMGIGFLAACSLFRNALPTRETAAIL